MIMVVVSFPVIQSECLLAVERLQPVPIIQYMRTFNFGLATVAYGHQPLDKNTL